VIQILIPAALGFRQPTITYSGSAFRIAGIWVVVPVVHSDDACRPRELRTEEHPMSHTDRLTVFLDDRDNRALRSARIKDGVPAADRIRAAVQLWQHGGPVTDRINSRAANLRRERLARNAVGAERQIKVSVVLGEVTHRALAQARIEDSVPASERVRAALHLWQQDPQFRVAVDELAAELRRQRYADRAAGGHPAVPPDLAMTAS